MSEVVIDNNYNDITSCKNEACNRCKYSFLIVTMNKFVSTLPIFSFPLLILQSFNIRYVNSKLYTAIFKLKDIKGSVGFRQIKNEHHPKTENGTLYPFVGRGLPCFIYT